MMGKKGKKKKENIGKRKRKENKQIS